MAYIRIKIGPVPDRVLPRINYFAFFSSSPIANFAKAEGELVERGQLFFDGSNATTRLQIQDLKTTDEGEYKCEITFLDITKDCPVVQLVKLTTLGKICFFCMNVFKILQARLLFYF